MPRWLGNTLIVLGFLALVGLAFLPRNVNVTIQIDDSSYHQQEPGHAGVGRAPAEPEE